MWSASQTLPSRGTAPASRRRRRTRETALYPAMASTPASHTRAAMATGASRGSAAVCSSPWGSTVFRASFTPSGTGRTTCGSGAWTTSCGTYSTTVAWAAAARTGASVSPSRENPAVRDTGHSRRNSTTAHRA